MKRLVFLGWLICAAAAQEPAAPQPPPFPVLPATVDADPTDRHDVTVNLPTDFKVTRNKRSVTMAPIGFQDFKLTVGKNMTTGIKLEDAIRRHEESKSRGYTMMGGGLNWRPEPFILSLDGKSYPKGDFVFEYTVTIFETDMPTQHMWSPESGKAYRVLWTHTYQVPVK